MNIKFDYEELTELVDNLEFLILDHEFDERYLIYEIYKKLKNIQNNLKKAKYNDLLIIEPKLDEDPFYEIPAGGDNSQDLNH